MTYYGVCEKCKQPVTSPSVPAYAVMGFEVPREQGGTNHIRNRRRVPGQVWHEACLPRESENELQERLAI